jgi:hypothetical protein
MELITFQCDGCQQVLRVGADKAGLQAKCPRCSKPLLIPSASTAVQEAPQPAPIRVRQPARRDDGYAEDRSEDDRPRGRRDRRDEEDDYDDRPRRGRGRDDYDEEDYDDDRPRRRRPPVRRPKWHLVRVGLLIVSIGACVLAGGYAVHMISDLLLVIALAGKKAGPASAFVTVEKVARVIMYLAAVGMVVGYVFGIFAPNKNGAMPLGIVVLALGGINLILRLIFWLLPIFGSGVRSHVAVEIVFELVYVAELILFLLFLRAVALCFKDRWFAQGCANQIFLIGGYGAAFIVMGVMTIIFQKSPSEGMLWVITIFRWICNIIMAAFLAMFIPNLFRSQGVIE